ncbi:hypothetical protein DUNSADRAFT_10888 [Dunaliella salina]|uniref:Encoded protein n=1 Tax=Dunaliella salina TaxID=3046 RepID=A0ABQ7H4N6_DUNSA|nr:hypothetical protein DUNSADRAFT_10888 [Dunaliella salina]|eukprot:KAF5841825.1 hypothetical protein DUNSADRAFT_10888 [Dunaliella salina]
MLRYRGKRKPWDSFTSRLLRKLCEGSDPNRHLVIGIGASKMPPAAHGVHKFVARTQLWKALIRALLRGVGHSWLHLRLMMSLNERNPLERAV